MSTTRDLLTAVQRKFDLPSDYALHLRYKISRQMVSAYMGGDVDMGDDLAIRVADDLDLNRAAVLAAVAADRTKSEPARKALRDAVKRLGGIAAAVLVSVGAGGPTLPPSGGAQATEANPVYYVKSRRRAAWWAALGGVTRALAFLIGASSPRFA